MSRAVVAAVSDAAQRVSPTWAAADPAPKPLPSRQVDVSVLDPTRSTGVLPSHPRGSHRLGSRIRMLKQHSVIRSVRIRNTVTTGALASSAAGEMLSAGVVAGRRPCGSVSYPFGTAPRNGFAHIPLLPGPNSTWVDHPLRTTQYPSMFGDVSVLSKAATVPETTEGEPRTTLCPRRKAWT